MKISEKKLQALRARARGVGRAAAGGIKGSGIQVLAGALTCYGNQKLAENSEFYRSQFFIGPAAIGVVGHLLKKKPKFAHVGNAMLGAAGYALAQNYALSRSVSAADRPDTGAVYRPSAAQIDAGAVYYPGAAQLSPGAVTSGTAATSSYSRGGAAAAAAL